MAGIEVLLVLVVWVLGATVLLVRWIRPDTNHGDVAGLAHGPSVRFREDRRIVLVAATAAVCTALLVVLATGLPVLAVTAGAGSCWLPFTLARHCDQRLARDLHGAWPDAIDVLAAGVRAGLSLPEAVSDLGIHGPEPLRPAFNAFAAHLRTDSNFATALDRLKDNLADPVADRVIESLRIARDVGGTDLGRLLRTLSMALRDEGRLRAEVTSRQSWTVNAARLAVVAPWLTLALLALRPSSLAAYGTPTGGLVLAGAGVTCWVAYRMMLRIGRLPVEARALR